jgi:hypothetical protein
MSRKRTLPPSAGCRTPIPHFDSLDALVADYLARYGEHRRDQHEWYRRAGDLRATIQRAGLAQRQDQSVEPHQRRIGRPRLREWAARLSSISPHVEVCRTFDELLSTLESVHFKGIGSLAIYDTAVRIGAFMDLAPDGVYVHAGAARGARALGLPVINGVVQRADLPEAMQALTCDQIEDCLCIYKDELARFNPAMRRSTSPSPPRTQPCD